MDSYLEISIGPLGSREKIPLDRQVNSYHIGCNPTQRSQNTQSIGVILIDRQASAVSDNHAILARDREDTTQWNLFDFDSTNGCFRNGIRVRTTKLADRDEIWLGPVNGPTSAQLLYHDTSSSGLLQRSSIPPGERFVLDPKVPNKVRVGKSVGPDELQLLGHQVDDVHAVILKSEIPDGYVYEIKHVGDNHETFVNGKLLSRDGFHQLADGDQLLFGDCKYIVRQLGINRLLLTPPGAQSDEHIWASDIFYSVQLDYSVWLKEYLRYSWRKLFSQTSSSTQLRPPERKKTLLRDVDMVVGPGDFIILAGASGSGKTTLMRSLSTVACPQLGTLEYKGRSYKGAPEVLRPHIGYVPQDDIVHEQLTVYDELRFAARLRLPVDFSERDREECIQTVLRRLRLTSQTLQPIKKLSGGQRKRVNIAVELLKTPGILFLDEPMEGQDLDLEEDIMLSLRKLADAGTSVVLVSHRLNFLEHVDYIGWMAPGGHLVYFGPPDQLFARFSVPSDYPPSRRYAEIYKRVNNLPHLAQFAEEYKQSQLYQKHVYSRKQPPNPLVSPGHSNIRADAASLQRFLYQFHTLYERQWSMVRADLGYLILMIVLPFFIGVLLILLASPDMFAAAARGDIVPAQQLLFPLSVCAVMIGTFASMRELVKERTIYRRERMVGLSVGAYLLSKIAVLSTFGLYQCALLVGMLLVITSPGPPGVFLWGPLEMYFTVFLTYLAGMSLGLFLSAVVRTQEMIMTLASAAIIPQFLLSKALGFSLTGCVSWLAQMTFTYWTLEALGDSGGLYTAGDPKFTGASYDPTASHLLVRWAVLVGLACAFLVLAWWGQTRHDKYQHS
jgi:ABC-type multidrug transport system ATPase subunit